MVVTARRSARVGLAPVAALHDRGADQHKDATYAARQLFIVDKTLRFNADDLKHTDQPCEKTLHHKSPQNGKARKDKKEYSSCEPFVGVKAQFELFRFGFYGNCNIHKRLLLCKIHIYSNIEITLCQYGVAFAISRTQPYLFGAFDSGDIVPSIKNPCLLRA